MQLFKPERGREKGRGGATPDVAPASVASTTARGASYADGKKALQPRGGGSDGKVPGQAAFEQAQAAFSKGELDVALSLFVEAWGVLENGPRAGSTAFNIAQCLRRLGHPIEAGEWYERSLATGQVEAYRAEILGHITEGRKAKGARDAEAELEAMGATQHKGVSDERGQAKSAFAKANKAFSAKDYALAATLYTDALLDPKTPGDRGPMMFNLAQCYRLSGDPAKAAAWYTTCLIDGGAKIAEHIPEVERRLAECQKAAGMATDTERGRFDDANERYSSGDFKGAIDGFITVYRSAALPHDRRAVVAYNIAQCYRRSGAPAEAVRWYERALGAGGGAYDAEIKGYIASSGAAADKETAAVDAMIADVKRPKSKKSKASKKADAAPKGPTAAAPPTAGV